MDTHKHNGNCWHDARRCEECGVGNLCDVCHDHDEPRGDCAKCEPCTDCEQGFE